MKAVVTFTVELDPTAGMNPILLRQVVADAVANALRYKDGIKFPTTETFMIDVRIAE